MSEDQAAVPPAGPANQPEAKLNPDIPEPLKLDDLARHRLESLLWKKRAMYYRARDAESKAESARKDVQSADLEFLRYARSLGIDVKMTFEISEAGIVTYVDPNSGAYMLPTDPIPRKK